MTIIRFMVNKGVAILSESVPGHSNTQCGVTNIRRIIESTHVATLWFKV